MISRGSAVVTGAFDGFFYVEDPSRTSGIKVMSSASVAIDDVVSLTGVVGTVNGERVINAMSVNKVDTARVGPLAASGRSLVGAGGPSTGLPVKAWGNVTYVDPSGAFAYVDDGSQLNDGNADGHIGVMVMLAGSGLTDVTSTNFLIVSGPLGRASNGTVVVPVIWAASGSKNP